MAFTFVNTPSVQPIAGQEVLVATLAGGPFDGVDAFVQGGFWAGGELIFRVYATVGAVRSRVAEAPFSGPEATRLQWDRGAPLRVGATSYDLVVFAKQNPGTTALRGAPISGTPPLPISATFAGCNTNDVVPDTNVSGAGALPADGSEVTITTALGYVPFADVSCETAGLPLIRVTLYASCGPGSVEVPVASQQSGLDATEAVMLAESLPIASLYTLRAAKVLADGIAGPSCVASLSTFAETTPGGGGPVLGTPNTMAYFNAAGILSGTPTFVSVDAVLGYVLVGATATDHGSAARVQNTSLVTNGAQFRSNQYGNNAAPSGFTGFKSRSAAIGTLVGLLPGDPISRWTIIGACPDNVTFPLAAFLTVQVPANFVPAGQSWLPTEFELELTPLAGPANSHRPVFKVTSEGETQTLRGIRAGGPATLPTNLSTGTLWSSGAGAPNGTIVGSPGDLYSDTAGGAANTLWVKESGVATNTGWVAYSSGSNNALTIEAVDRDVLVAEFAPASGEWYVGMSGLTLDRTVNLPAGMAIGSEIIVKDEDGSLGAHNIILQPAGGLLIDGNANYTMTVAQNGLKGSVRVMMNGNNQWALV